MLIDWHELKRSMRWNSEGSYKCIKSHAHTHTHTKCTCVRLLFSTASNPGQRRQHQRPRLRPGHEADDGGTDEPREVAGAVRRAGAAYDATQSVALALSAPSGGWKCAVVGVPWRGPVSACLALGDLLVNDMFKPVLKRLSLMRHHDTPMMAHLQLPDFPVVLARPDGVVLRATA